MMKTEQGKNKINGQLATISDLAHKFLASQQIPCHIDIIVKYISRYRPCNKSDIEEHCTPARGFRIISPEYLALSSKKYNIREWKKQNIVAFGTIADFAEKFLSSQDNPCNIREIAAYVLKYRQSDANSIRTRCERDKRFFQIMNGYFGLRFQKYNLEEWKKQNNYYLYQWRKKRPVSSTADYAADFLAKQSTPCHADLVFEYISQFRKTSSKSVRVILAHNKRFFTIGDTGYTGLRSKKFNLPAWKKQNIEICGTNPDLAEKFLTTVDTPCHADEISKYIMKYRPCKAQILYGHCSADKRRFITIKPGYIGLRSKKYNLEEWKKQNITTLVNIDLIEEFLSKRDVPCSAREVAEYVSKYHTRSVKEIMDTCRHSDRFICIKPEYVGLCSKKYDLDEWKKQNIAALGTLADIMTKFLEGEDVPRQLGDIVNYVGKFRKPNKMALVQSLGSDSRFIRLALGYYGLRSKKYNLEEWRRSNTTGPGVIGNLAEEFIASHGFPCHKDDILKYIEKYRKSSDSVLKRLFAKDSRFIRIAPGYIGLRSKSYNLEEWKKLNIASVNLGERKEQKGITLVTIGDLIDQYLEQRAMPCHMDEIAQNVLKRRKFKVSNIKWQCDSDKRFINIGHGYFALRSQKLDIDEWKKQNITVFGSIADLAEHFLNRFDVPCHESEIRKYITKYLTCSAKSLQNYCYEDVRFIQLGQRYIGLQSKKYDLVAWRKQMIAVLGSCADIAAIFMEKQSSLCQLKVIAKYVRKFRKTKTGLIIDYIRKDHRFVLYKNGYAGLWGKDYDEQELEQHKLSTGRTLGDLINQFLVKRKAPSDLQEIGTYISQYRVCDQNWILNNLKEDKRFRILKNRQIELRKNKVDIKQSKV